MRTSNDDREWSYVELFDEAIGEAELDGTLLAIPSVIDRVLARHQVSPEQAANWREGMVAELSRLVEFPCPADFGPTLQCQFMQGHLNEGLDHEPMGRMYEPLIEELDEWRYLLEAARDLGR